MRHRVVLQNRGGTATDTRGHYGDNWQDVGESRPAAIVTLSGRDSEIARQLFPQATHRIRVRSDEAITPKSRFLFKGRCLYVGHVENVDEVGRWMHCLCSEGRE